MFLLVRYLASKKRIFFCGIQEKDTALAGIEYLGNEPRKTIDEVFELIGGIDQAVNTVNTGN
jgi:hypothetical protein